MLARDLSKLYPGATFVVDVKSTGLFESDPVLKAQGVKADYWKTGHQLHQAPRQRFEGAGGFRKIRPFLLQCAGWPRL